jgi:hypothetical protein
MKQNTHSNIAAAKRLLPKAIDQLYTGVFELE